MKQIVPHLFVEDVDKNIDYYKNVLGFEAVYIQSDKRPHNFAILKNANVEVMVGDMEMLWKYIPELKGKPLVNSSIFYFEMEDVSSYYEKIKSKTEIVKELRYTWYNTREFWIKDCNGYLLAFFQNV